MLITMLSDCDLVAFLPTTDLDRSRRFFAQIVGLPIIEDTPFACVFDAHGTTLRVTPVASLVPRSFTALGWIVPDVIAAVNDLVEAGVVFERFDGMEQDELGIWKSPSGDVAWFKDPDGNVLSLTGS